MDAKYRSLKHLHDGGYTTPPGLLDQPYYCSKTVIRLEGLPADILLNAVTFFFIFQQGKLHTLAKAVTLSFSSLSQDVATSAKTLSMQYTYGELRLCIVAQAGLAQIFRSCRIV